VTPCTSSLIDLLRLLLLLIDWIGLDWLLLITD
jgi:hypothetical protein